MKGLVCLLLLLETFVFVDQQTVNGGLNERNISQQLSSDDRRQNQTDTLRAEASADIHLGFPNIHEAVRVLTATVTEQKANLRDLTATVTEQKANIRDLTATVTEQKANIRDLTATVTEQKANLRDLTATVTEQKANIRDLTATVTEQKANLRDLTATVTEQKANIRDLTATVTEQKANIRDLTATVTEQKANIRDLTATVTEQKANIRALETRLREQQTFSLEELKKKTEETLSQVEELRKENRGREIAFSAGLTHVNGEHTGPFTSQSTLIYKNVHTNKGNAYNPITGIFTAPLKGAYMFRISVYGHGLTGAAASIIKNEEQVISAEVLQHRSNASNGIVLLLEVGDTVYVRLWSSRQLYDNSQDKLNSFSGFLLFPLK